MNKTIVIGSVVLLVIVGGLFLLLGGTEPKSDLGEPKSDLGESGADTIPTQWSQAGDYEIEEVAGQQTVVTNQKAGFSFKVPVGWRVEDQEGELEREYVLNILSPDAAFSKGELGENIAILGGCIFSIETEYQKDTVIALNTRIASVRENPGRYERDTSREAIVEISGNVALKTSLTPPLDSKYYQQFGESIRIELSLDEDSIVRFGTRFLKNDKEYCSNRFEAFSNNLNI